jgi:hypothetical protein
MPRSSRDPVSTLIETLRLRRRRPALLALLASVLVAQAALVVHRIDHNAASHSAFCAACVAADHAANSGSTPALAIVPQAPARIAVTRGEPATTTVLHAYRSRAPPDRSYA